MKQLTDLEKLLFIALDGVGDAEGVIFEFHWDIPKKEKQELLALYEEWNNQFHLIAKPLNNNINELIRFDIDRINPEEFYNELPPGAWNIICTEKDYLINLNLTKLEGYSDVHIKE